MRAPRSTLSRGEAAGVALFAALAAVLPLLAGAQAREDGRQAYVFAPWLDAPAVLTRLAAADLGLVRFGRVPFVVVAERLGDTATRPPGALFRLDPAGAIGCWLSDRTT